MDSESEQQVKAKIAEKLAKAKELSGLVKAAPAPRYDDVFFEGVEAMDSNEFKPCVGYYSAMNLILYLNEDCSYRAQYVDSFLEVLWHPYEDKIVGIKLKLDDEKLDMDKIAEALRAERGKKIPKGYWDALKKALAELPECEEETSKVEIEPI